MIVKLTISIILASLPFFSYFLRKHFSKKEGQLDMFNHHWTTRYSDWLLVPFNLIFLYAVKIDYTLLIVILILSILVNYIFHKIWGKENKQGKEKIHFYHKNSTRINNAGKTHFVFAVIELTMIITFFINSITNIFFYIGLTMLAIFACLGFVGSKKIHGKIKRLDLFAEMLFIAIILLKLLLFS